VKLNYKLDVLKEAAIAAGFQVMENASAFGADRSVLAANCELVIKTRSGDFGFVKGAGDEVAMHSGFGGKDTMFDAMAEKILPSYVELALRQHGRGLSVLNRTSNMAQIHLTVGRS